MGNQQKDSTSGVGALQAPQNPQPSTVLIKPGAELQGKPRLEIALGIVGRFEGKGYGALAGGADGQGLSGGIVQWNFGQGTIQQDLLKAAHESGIPVDSLFPEPIMHLVTKGTNAEDVRWVEAHMLDSKKKLRPEWAKAWAVFLTRPDMVKIQIKKCERFEKTAANMMEAHRFSSLRAFCWMFDTVILNGTLKQTGFMTPDRDACAKELAGFDIQGYGADEAKKNVKLWTGMVKACTPEQVSLLRMAMHRALQSKPEYFSDVLNRRGTIAMGMGFCHGELMELPQLGSSDLVPAKPAPTPVVVVEKPAPSPGAGPITREKIALALVTKMQVGVHAKWRETKGYNRSPEIDERNKYCGVALGSPYCQATVTYAIHQVCQDLGLKNPCPKTAGTQDFWAKVPKKFKRERPLIGDVMTQQSIAKPGNGHTGVVRETPAKDATGFLTYEANTDAIKGDREGDGWYAVSRSFKGDTEKRLLGFSDVASWIAEHNGV